ncbi:UxaA family hydrolase [Chloroflexota bacterium]
MKRKAIILTAKDNVATSLTQLEEGEVVKMEIGDGTATVVLIDAIPFGHKFSLTRIKAKLPIIKYGEKIGEATADIQPGQHVHVHNVVSTRGRGDLSNGVKR